MSDGRSVDPMRFWRHPRTVRSARPRDQCVVKLTTPPYPIDYTILYLVADIFGTKNEKTLSSWLAQQGDMTS